MTTPDEHRAIAERLRTKRRARLQSRMPDDDVLWELRNPDGPTAADAMDALLDRLAALTEQNAEGHRQHKETLDRLAALEAERAVIASTGPDSGLDWRYLRDVVTPAPFPHNEQAWSAMARILTASIRQSAPRADDALLALLGETREQLNDVSAITSNLVWRQELGMLIDRIDAALARQPAPRADDELRSRLQNWRDNLEITRGSPVPGDHLHGPALDFVIEQLDGILRKALASEKPTAEKGD